MVLSCTHTVLRFDSSVVSFHDLCDQNPKNCGICHFQYSRTTALSRAYIAVDYIFDVSKTIYLTELISSPRQYIGLNRKRYPHIDMYKVEFNMQS